MAKTGRVWGTIVPLPAPLLVEAARRAEASGLEGVFAPQVYGPPFIPLAAAAAVTERIKIASGIAIAAARSPFETAMAARDLDMISGGRFVLGLGSSVLTWSRDVFGAPEHKPMRHLRETVAAVRHILAGAHLGLEPFEGEYYKADFRELQPLDPPVRTEIPIWVAALREPAVRLAAEIADGIMIHPIASNPTAMQRLTPVIEESLRRFGRQRDKVEVHLWPWVMPNSNEAEALDDSRQTIAFYAGIKQYESFFEAQGFGDEARRLQKYIQSRSLREAVSEVPDAMVESMIACGAPDRVRAWVSGLWEAADSLCPVNAFYGLPPEKAIAYQMRMAEAMAPG